VYILEIVPKIHAIESYGFSSNCYVIGQNEIAIVDTGASAEYAKRIINVIKEIGLNPNNITKIIITHHHPDHTGGILGFIKILGSDQVTIYVHESGIRFYKNRGITNIYGLKDGETIEIDGLKFLVIHTPGHTEDGICLYNSKYKLLISGDTVFSYGSIGRTDLPGGNILKLVKSIEKLLKLDVEYLLPGHMEFVTEGNRQIQQSYRFARSCMSFY